MKYGKPLVFSIAEYAYLREELCALGSSRRGRWRQRFSQTENPTIASMMTLPTGRCTCWRNSVGPCHTRAL